MKNTYIKRDIEEYFLRHVRSFPVVAVTGARQTGKTTLIRHVLKDYDFISLDNLNIRNTAVKDPKRFVESLRDKTIIDEVQYAPDILSYIKMRVDDERDKRGNFILTGSQQFLMMKGLTETLAGRIGILNLYPFSVTETEKKPFNTMKVFSRYALVSSYPEPLTNKNVDLELWYNNYINTYIEKDVKSLNEIIHAPDFSIFMKILSLRVSQMLNMSTLAAEVKVTVPTIKKWLSVLEASNIIYFLRPYHANLKKRFVKTPKVYFYDTATACSMCGISNEKKLYESGMLGALFENFCVTEARKYMADRGIKAEMSYIRTNTGLEVDLLIEKEGRFNLVEIKASKSVSGNAGSNMLEAVKSIIPAGKAESTDVITLTDETGVIPGGAKYGGIGRLLDILGGGGFGNG